MSRGILICTILTLPPLLGCDKVKSLTEKPAPANPAQPSAAPAVPVAPPPAPPTPPPAKQPDQVIAEFLAISPYQRSEARILEVAELPTGLEQIQELDLSKSPLTPAGIEALARFPELRRLNLSDTAVTDEMTILLAKLPKLQSLQLARTSLSNLGMSHLSTMEGLKELDISSTPINDAALPALGTLRGLEVLRIDNNPNLYGQPLGVVIQQRGLPELKVLSAGGTKIGYYGLNDLNRLKNLEEVYLSQSNTTDEALKDLGSCPNLKILDLRDNPITDAGVKPLAKLKNLKELNLQACRTVTSDSLVALKGMKGLTRLDVSGTACTPDNVQELANKYLKETAILFNGQEY